MINDAMIAAGEAHPVHRLACQVAQPKADEANNRVAASKAAESVVADADAFARRCLPGDGQELILAAEDEFGLQADEPGDVEDDGARTGGFDRLAQ